MDYELSEKALNTMLLHTLKHHNKDCIGLLIGYGPPKNGIISIVESIPLFHESVMVPSLENALFLVERFVLAEDEGLRIAGVYDAPAIAPKRDPCTPIARVLNDKIREVKGGSGECALFRVSTESVKVPSEIEGREREGGDLRVDVSHWVGNQERKGTLLNPIRQDDLMKHVFSGAYLQVADFDDHFENPALDWTNEFLK